MDGSASSRFVPFRLDFCWNDAKINHLFNVQIIIFTTENIWCRWKMMWWSQPHWRIIGGIVGFPHAYSGCFYFDLKDVDSTQLRLALAYSHRWNLIFIGKVCPSSGKRGFLQSVQTFLSAIWVSCPSTGTSGGFLPWGPVLPRATPGLCGLATGESASRKSDNPLGFARPVRMPDVLSWGNLL